MGTGNGFSFLLQRHKTYVLFAIENHDHELLGLALILFIINIIITQEIRLLSKIARGKIVREIGFQLRVFYIAD